MFVRVNTTPNSPRKSVQVVENTRLNGKVKTKILRHVGIAMDQDEEQKLKAMARDVITKMMIAREELSAQRHLFDQTSSPLTTKKGRKPTKRIEDIIPVNKVTLNKIVEERRVVEGLDEVGGHVFESMGFDTIFKSKKDSSLLKDLVLARLIYPHSKHKLQQVLFRHLNKDHELQSIYRLMDKLHPLINQIKTKVFDSSRSLFPNNTVDLMLFDVTTLYFESEEVDELRAFGYSKDHRFNTTQVVLALATNADGLPIGYELFLGNTSEVKTLIASIESWQKLFHIKDVCFVGDRAMFCEENLALMEAKGYKYIVAAKLRSMSKTIQEELLNESNYVIKSFGNELGWIGEFDYKGRRLISGYKSKRARHDAKKRQQILDKISKMVGKEQATSKLISNSGIKKYTKGLGKGRLELDQAKIDMDAAWDGIHGVITNITDLDSIDILSRYKRLWVIEESFRINKHNLKIRPIYHFKKERIEAHIALCYMSFALLKQMQYRIALTKKISVVEIIEELLGVQSSIYVHIDTKDRYRVPSSMTNYARRIYQTFNLQRSLHAEIYLK